MKYTINSRKLGKEVTFSRPGTYYVFVNLNGEPGTLGNQLCDGGELTGNTILFHENDQEAFEKICRNWWKLYLKKNVNG